MFGDFTVAECPFTQATQQHLMRPLVGDIAGRQPANARVAKLALQTLAQLASEVIARRMGVAQLNDADRLVATGFFKLLELFPQRWRLTVAVILDRGELIGARVAREQEQQAKAKISHR